MPLAHQGFKESHDLVQLGLARPPAAVQRWEELLDQDPLAHHVAKVMKLCL